MVERGWTHDVSKWLEGRVLDAVFAAAEDGWEADFGAVAEDCGVGLGEVDAVLGSLRDRGLILVEGTPGGGLSAGGVLISEEGRVAAWDRIQRRGDLSQRAVACRDAVLHWMYGQKRAGVHFPIPTKVRMSPEGWFEGEQFTEREVDDAGQFLRSRGLLKSSGGSKGPVLRGEITPEGEQVVEEHDSSLQTAGSAGRYSGQQIVTHFHGPVSGQVGIGQVQQTQNVGVGPEVVAALLADVREAASSLEPLDQAYVSSYVDAIQAEVSGGDPSAEFVKTGGERVKSIAAKAGNAGLSAAMSALVNGVTKAYFGA